MFDYYNNNIIINETYLFENIDSLKMVCLLDNIAHETYHFYQKNISIYDSKLKAGLPFPYNILLQYEQDAYNFANDFLAKYEKYDELNIAINTLKQSKNIYKNIAIKDLKKRGYSVLQEDIEMQAEKLIGPFESVYTFKELKENEIPIKNILYKKQSIEIFEKDFIFYGCISIVETDGINKLFFSMKNNTCFLDGLFKEDDKDIVSSISNKNKQILINIFNKFVNANNEIKIFNFDAIKIVPISIVDTKSEHEKIIKKITKPVLHFGLNDIPKEQIKTILSDER